MAILKTEVEKFRYDGYRVPKLRNNNDGIPLEGGIESTVYFCFRY
jgi:hypothetical protein